MEQVKFTYQKINGNKVDVDRSALDIDGFESDWTNKIHEKYKENIVAPEVVVILSDDGKTINKAHLVGDGLLS